MPLPKSQKELFAARKSLNVLKLLKILIDSALFRFSKGSLKDAQ